MGKYIRKYGEVISLRDSFFAVYDDGWLLGIVSHIDNSMEAVAVYGKPTTFIPQMSNPMYYTVPADFAKYIFV